MNEEHGSVPREREGGFALGVHRVWGVGCPWILPGVFF